MEPFNYFSWDEQEQKSTELLEQVQLQMLQRDMYKDRKSMHDGFTASINESLEQLRVNITTLRKNLEQSSAYKQCLPEELQRRHKVVAKLSNSWKRLYEEMVRTTPQDVFNNTQMALPPAIVLGPSRHVPPAKKRQWAMLEDQDRDLEVLSQTLSRQRDLASQLGQEVDDQNDVLDNLANTMDRVESSVQRETSNISLVNRRDGTCGYWVVIIGLMVAIVIVAFL